MTSSDFTKKQNPSNPTGTKELAEKYSRSAFENTYYLGYRDLPFLIEKHQVGKGREAIDYGCGTGRSTRFLEQLGYNSLGVDTSLEMLQEARQTPGNSSYANIKSAEIPVVHSSYDLVLACFVMLTVSSKEEMLRIFKEVYRVLKPEGVFIIVTASEELYSRKWLSYDVDFPQNKNLTSGSVAKIVLKDLGIEYVNYFWTDADYVELSKEAKFEIAEKSFPLGYEKERRDWESEMIFPPYAVYVLKKNG